MSKEKEYRCHACKEVVHKDATKCPHCGTKYPTISNGKGCLSTFLLCAVIAILWHSCGDSNEDLSSPQVTKNNVAEVSAPKWYENGGLQTESALVWQTAPYNRKLATAADIYAFFWLGNKLSPSLMEQIKSMDDLKPLAENLVQELDVAFKPADTKDENTKLFTNQKVSTAAVMILIMKNQLKK